MIFNKLIPELGVSDLQKSLSFYVDTLGFKIEYQREEAEFAFLSLNDVQIMIEKANDYWKTGKLEYPYGRGMNFQIKVDDISLLMSKLEQIKYPIFAMPEENWYRANDIHYGYKEFLVLDPDGYLLRFAQELGSKKDVN